MALFTDGAFNGIEELQHYENSILNVASTEGIDLAAKRTLARDEIGTQLLLFILRHPVRDSRAAVRRWIGLGDVVMTDPLKRWHVFATLAMIYRDAYNNQLNDRYLGKWNEYQHLAQIASTEYLQLGVGIVADPIVKASSPMLAPVPGTGTGGSYFVGISWVNAEGQEGSIGDVQAGAVTAGLQLEVAAPNPPANAAGWNVYAGMSANNLMLQNSIPIPVGNAWILPSILLAGTVPGDGQVPERYLIHDRLLQRG